MDDLNEHLRQIENRLVAIENKLNIQSYSPLPVSEKQPPSPSSFKPYAQTTPNYSPFNFWLKENWLVSIGILLMILATGWFISYAFANDWIEETMRVFFGCISGAIVYLIGLWLLKKHSKGGQSLIILGEAIAIMALFAAHQFFSILPTFYAFLLMFSVVNVTTIIAIKNNLEELGLSSIIFTTIIPILIGVSSLNPIFLMSYVLIIDAAVLWMWTMKGWGKAFQTVYLATLTYSFFFVTIQNQLIANFFVWAFYSIFFLPIAFSIYRKKLPSLPLKGAFILLSLALTFMLWINDFIQFPWNSISYFTASLSWAALGYFMTRNWNQIESKNNVIKYILGITIGFSTILLLFMATSKLTYHLFLYPVSSDTKTILYLIETTTAISIGYFLLQSSTVSIYLSLFFIIPLSIILNSSTAILYAPFLSFKFAILCTALISLFIAAEINRKALLHSESSNQKLILHLLWIAASAFAMMLIWNICHQIFAISNIARGIALVLYVIAAEILIYIGNLKGLKNFRIGGFAMISFVVLRLIGEEVWKMPIIVRTATFFVIGLLLLGTAFFDKQYKRIKDSNIKRSNE